MQLKKFALGVLLCLGAVSCRVSHADTLKLVGTGGQVVGNVYVYPYNFSIDGSPSSTSMMCLNFNDEITEGETWYAQPQHISTTDTSSTAVGYREDAWLYSQLGTNGYTNAEIQFAVWDVFDPSGVSGNSAFDSVAQNLVSQAAKKATDPTLLSDGFFNQYEVFVPTGDQSGWTAGTPQTFIVNSSAVTPEPSSLLLLATGLFGGSMLVLRRRGVEA